MNVEVNEEFKKLCGNVHAFNGKHIPSPSEQRRRGAVAAILRWRTSHTNVAIENKAKTIDEFFKQEWVLNDPEGQAEILFMQRATRVGDRWSGHVAFPGGKNEELETDEETCKREVWEEVGLDLNSDDFIQVGKLDEREIVSVASKKLLMMLIPFVYLQVTSETPAFKLQESEVAAVQWIPLSFFFSKEPYPHNPIIEPLTLVRSKSKWKRALLGLILGTIAFPSVYLPSTDTTAARFRLWGLTMGMTKDLIKLNDTNHVFVKLTETLPGYSWPDIGWLTYMITKVNILRKNRKDGWDKVYFGSLRNAVIIAVLLRGTIALALAYKAIRILCPR